VKATIHPEAPHLVDCPYGQFWWQPRGFSPCSRYDECRASPYLGVAPPQASSLENGSSDTLPGRRASSGLHTGCASRLL